MSLTNTLASLALGVATESGSSLLENAFDAATSELAQEGREMAHDASHSLSRHLARNPRHALEQNPPRTRILDTRIVDTRFLPRSPLTTPVQDLAWAGIGATGQMGAGDLVQTGLGDDLALAYAKHVSEWEDSGNLRFYGEPLLLLTLLGGAGLAGLGLGAVALRALARKLAPVATRRTLTETPKTEAAAETSPKILSTRSISLTHDFHRVVIQEEISEDPDKTKHINVSVVDVKVSTEEASETTEPRIDMATNLATKQGEQDLNLRTQDGLLDVRLHQTIYIDDKAELVFSYRVTGVQKVVPPEDRPTEAGGTLELDPPSRADPPTRVNATIDEVPVGGAPADLGAPPLSGEASGFAALPFGPIPTPAPREEADEDDDIEIDLSGLSDSAAPDVSAVANDPGEDILTEGDTSDGSGVIPVQLAVQARTAAKDPDPIVIRDTAVFSQSSLGPSFDSNTFPQHTAPEDGDGVATQSPPPHAVLAPAAAPEEIATEDTLKGEDADEVLRTTGVSGEDTHPGSQQQRDQLEEEVLAAPVPVAQPAAKLSRFLPPEEPAEPAGTAGPVRPVPPLPIVIPRRVAPLPDVPDPLPVAVGPAPAEPRPVRPVPPRPFISPMPPAPEPAPGGNVVTLPAPLLPTPRPMPVPKPAPSYWEQGTAWLFGMWNALNGLVSSRVEEAERPANDPLVYKGPVSGSKSSEPMQLRVPFANQQIKDRMIIPNFDGTPSPVVMDLSSRPLQRFLARAFPFETLNGLDASSTARLIHERYSHLLKDGNSFSRVPAADATMDRGLDEMIIEGHLRNEAFAAIMMQITFERLGIYSEIILGKSQGENTTAIAVYVGKHHRGNITLIDVTNVRLINLSLFTPASTDWLPRPSKRERK